MCELFAMSSRHPTDVRASFKGSAVLGLRDERGLPLWRRDPGRR
jgi:hypothetical protein